jgi:transposase-like protein
MTTSRRTFDPAFKARLACLHLDEGQSYESITQQHDVSLKSLQRWVRVERERRRDGEPAPEEGSSSPAAARAESATVGRYLDVLARKSPQGRRTPEFMEARLGEVKAALVDASPYDRVILTQERLDLQRDLAQRITPDDIAHAEKGFIDVGASWARRKGVGYEALRIGGVPAEVLKQAGIPR